MVGLVDAIAKIFKLINKLLEVQTERRRKIFSELLVPLFHKMEEVHSSYRELFTKALQALPYQRGDAIWEIPNANKPNPSIEEVNERVEKVKR